MVLALTFHLGELSHLPRPKFRESGKKNFYLKTDESHSCFSKKGRGNEYLGTISCLQQLNSWCLGLLGSEPNSL